jgi:transketolase
MADPTPTPAVKTVPKPRDQHLRDMADCIRFLSMDAVQQAKSGHPGAPMGMADIATVLFKDFMQFDAADPHWFDRDRFVLSNGHASMLLYSLLYLTGFKDMTMDQLKRFRQIDSKTAGHPEYKHADGIETTTGPLGQGVANAVGFALAERIMNAKFGDDLCKHWTYVFMGDGCDGGYQRGSDLHGGTLQARPPHRLLGQQFDHDRRPDQPCGIRYRA